jgi:hypothetical protein
VVVLQATAITMQHLQHRLPEVVAAVAQRLVGVGRIAAAADLQEGMNDLAGATLCTFTAKSLIAGIHGQDVVLANIKA